MNESSSGRGCLLVLGILSLLAGLAAIGSPLMTGVWVTALIGAMLLLNGLFELFHAFSAKGWTAGVLAFLHGALALLAGGMLMARPVIGAALVGLLLIVFFFADGLARASLALKLKPIPGWGWQFAGGLASLLLGVMIWKDWPLSGMWALGVLVGIRILFAGIAILAVRAAAGTIEPA